MAVLRRRSEDVSFAPTFRDRQPVIPPTGIMPPSAGWERTSTDPLAEVHPLPASLEQKVQRLPADLEARGYEVARGYWSLWGAEDCK